jgi:hypothetical protein
MCGVWGRRRVLGTAIFGERKSHHHRPMLLPVRSDLGCEPWRGLSCRPVLELVGYEEPLDSSNLSDLTRRFGHDRSMPKKKQPGLVVLLFVRIRTELAQTIALADGALRGFVNTRRARHNAQHGLALRPRLLQKTAP